MMDYRHLWNASGVESLQSLLRWPTRTKKIDIEHQYDLLALIRNLKQVDNKTVIAVLHDLSMAMTHFEQIIIMDNGVIVSDGPAQSTINTEIISSVFRVNATISYDNHMTKPFVTYEPKSSLPHSSKNQETTA